MHEPIRWIAAVGCLVGAAACSPAPTDPGPPPTLIVRHVTVLDVVSGQALRDRCVSLAGDRIRSVAACGPLSGEQASGATVVDGSGRFLVPGLWDMHVHLTDATEVALHALVAFGVTTVRDMGGDLGAIDTWRSEIAAGTRVGPRIFRVGPVLDGAKPGAPHRVTITTPSEASEALSDLIDRGVDQAKVHNAVPRDAYLTLLEEANARGVKVVGHVPMTVSPAEAVGAGQAGLEHVATLFEGTFNARFADPLAALDAMESFPEAEAVQLARSMVAHHTAFTPTLVAYESRSRRALLAAEPDPRSAYVARSLREQWDRFFPASPRDAEPRIVAARDRAYRAWLRAVGAMHGAGVTVLAGTDLGARDVYPDSLHDELAQLVAAGLSPLDALRAATIAPARFMSADDPGSGTVSAGSPADLVLLEANPLEDIANSRRIVAVVARGKFFDRVALDAMLDRVRDQADGP